jgi:hypothetical protein
VPVVLGRVACRIPATWEVVGLSGPAWLAGEIIRENGNWQLELAAISSPGDRLVGETVEVLIRAGESVVHVPMDVAVEVSE